MYESSGTGPGREPEVLGGAGGGEEGGGGGGGGLALIQTEPLSFIEHESAQSDSFSQDVHRTKTLNPFL